MLHRTDGFFEYNVFPVAGYAHGVVHAQLGPFSQTLLPRLVVCKDRPHQSMHRPSIILVSTTSRIVADSSGGPHPGSRPRMHIAQNGHESVLFCGSVAVTPFLTTTTATGSSIATTPRHGNTQDGQVTNGSGAIAWIIAIHAATTTSCKRVLPTLQPHHFSLHGAAHRFQTFRQWTHGCFARFASEAWRSRR